MRGATIFVAVVVGLTWALTTLFGIDALDSPCKSIQYLTQQKKMFFFFLAILTVVMNVLDRISNPFRPNVGGPTFTGPRVDRGIYHSNALNARRYRRVRNEILSKNSRKAHMSGNALKIADL